MLSVTTCILFGSIWGLAKAMETAPIDGRQSYPVQQSLIHDLAAISVSQGEVFFPDGFSSTREPWTIEQIRRIYAPTLAPLYWGDPNLRHFLVVDKPTRIDELWQTWFATLPAHLGDYLEHRVRIFARMLGVMDGGICDPLHEGIAPNDLGIACRQSALVDVVMSGLRDVQNSLIFRGWFYAAVLIVTMVVLARKHKLASLPFIALDTSALCHVGIHPWISPGCNFRSNLWLVVCAMVLVVMTISRIPQPTDAPRSSR